MSTDGACCTRPPVFTNLALSTGKPPTKLGALLTRARIRHPSLSSTQAAQPADAEESSSRPVAPTARAEAAAQSKAVPGIGDVCGDRGVLKSTLRPGTSADVFPPSEARVRLRYTATIARGASADASAPAQLVEQSAEPFAECALGSGALVRGLEAAVRKMAQGELAKLLVRADYAYGAAGSAKLRVPPNAPLEYVVELLSWQVGGSEAADFAERECAR